MSFQDYSRSVVKNFLGSVVFIDDRIFTSKDSKITTQPVEAKTEISNPIILKDVPVTEQIITTQKIVITPPRKPVALTKDELANTNNGQEPIIKIEDVDINPKEFMSAFTKEGIHCSLCEYDEAELDSYKNLLQKSDVVILDWNMNSGKEEGYEARLLIKDLLEKDQESSLRLIVIYTSTPKTHWHEIINQQLKPIFGDRLTNLTDNSIISGHTKIVFFHKGDPALLPLMIIDQFVVMTSGLVSNTALNAIGLIRKNTNKILGSYHKELDPAYLTNRIHLATKKLAPQLSEDLIKDMIMGSIFDLIQGSDIKESCNEEQIGMWLDEVVSFKQNTIKINNNELDIIISERNIWLKYGFGEFQKQIIARLGNLKNPAIYSASKIKENPTEYFTPSNNKLNKPNEEFAILSHQKANYSGLRNNSILTLGCVVKYQHKEEKDENPESFKLVDKYLLSVQQPCDSLRLKKKEKRSYIFLELEQNLEDTKILLKDANVYKKLAPKLNSHFLRTFVFEETNDGLVQALNQKFTSVNGIEFEWMCDLKSNHAQRIINEFSAYLSRVGLDEPEFLRLS